MPLRVAISIGDYNGIGPEVVIKTLLESDPDLATPVVLSNRQVVEYYIKTLGVEADSSSFHFIREYREIKDGKINVLESYGNETPDIKPGELMPQAGKCAMLSVAKGVDLCLSEKADALVTAPISKEAIRKAGYKVPGHTEFLAERTGTEEVLMMLVNDTLRVALVSIHIPLRDVPEMISQSSVFTHLSILSRSLKKDFNIDDPNIAVLGLNPHAGDGGILGSEEIEIIEPAIRRAGSENISATGPYPADGFFGNRRYKEFDAILAMYHDQGLIPFKTLSFGAGVNFTAGLPIIRTSPDHGTAFDIAGKSLADPSSFSQAFTLAKELAHNRQEGPDNHG